MNGLDLFSGFGFLSVALAPWVSPVAYCEIDRYAQAVLLSRMASGAITTAAIWDDITTFPVTQVPKIDIVYGGFPCQPYSSAARGRNRKEDVVTSLVKVIRGTKPQYIFLENVSPWSYAKIVDRIKDGYNFTGPSVLSAAEVGGPFLGDRYWLFAKAHRNCKPIVPLYGKVAGMQEVADVIWSDTEPKGLRVDDGSPFRVERNRGMGNAVCWTQAREAFRRLAKV